MISGKPSGRANASERGFRLWPSLLWILLLLSTFAIAANTAGVKIACASVATLILSLLLVRSVADPLDFRSLTVSSICYMGWIAVNFLPSFFVYAEQSGPYRDTFLLGVHSVLITMPLGWRFTNWAMAYNPRSDNAYFAAPLSSPHASPRLRTIFLIMLSLACVLTVAYVIEVPVVPLFHLLRNPGDYLNLVLLREESFKLLDSPLLLAYFLLRMMLFPMLVLISFGAYFVSRETRWLKLFLFALAAGLFYNSLTLAKAPVAMLFLVLGIFTYFIRGRRLGARLFAAVLFLFLSFPVIVLVQAAEDLTIAEALLGIALRFAYLPAELLYYYFEVFPSHVGYLHGATINKFAMASGMTFFDTPNYIGLYAYPGTVDSISAPAAFIGNLNADFGMTGVIVGGFIAGVVVQWFHVHLMRRRKTIVNISAYALVTLTLLMLNLTALPEILLGNGAVLTLVLTWIIGLLCGDLSIAAGQTDTDFREMQ